MNGFKITFSKISGPKHHKSTSLKELPDLRWNKPESGLDGLSLKVRLA